MLEGKKITVVMPAYNAEKTLMEVYNKLPKKIVDEVILVDDNSNDKTFQIASRLKIKAYEHEKNLGYGANQKTCYKKALEGGADIIVMLHPDYQYPPKLVTAMASILCSEEFDIVLGSRVLCGMALKNGMPLYKYIANRALTLFENFLLNAKMSEYHTGYRAFTREVLLAMPILENSNDFVFDNQILVQAMYFGYRIGEISTPCRYTKDSSSISFKRSVVYGLGVVATVIQFIFQKLGLAKFSIFDKCGKKISV